MTSNRLPMAANGADVRCYRLTAKGRACIYVVENGGQTIGSLSRYLHDILLMCGSGVWFDQLREFMPPRPLEESLRALQALELIEYMPQDAPRAVAALPLRSRALTAFGQMACA